MRLLVMRIEEAVVGVIHATETQIQSTHEPHMLVDDDHLLMVGPQLRDLLVGVAVNLDVGREGLQVALRMLGVVTQRQRDLIVHDDHNGDASISYGLQHHIQARVGVLH